MVTKKTVVSICLLLSKKCIYLFTIKVLLLVSDKKTAETILTFKHYHPGFCSANNTGLTFVSNNGIGHNILKLELGMAASP